MLDVRKYVLIYYYVYARCWIKTILSLSLSLFFFSADFHDNLSKLLEQLFTLYPSKFVGERVRIRQTDDDGDAQTSAAGADQKEEYGWTHSFSVVPEVSLESSDIVVQEEGDA